MIGKNLPLWLIPVICCIEAHLRAAAARRSKTAPARYQEETVIRTNHELEYDYCLAEILQAYADEKGCDLLRAFMEYECDAEFRRWIDILCQPISLRIH
jgi:hypothetical protein